MAPATATTAATAAAAADDILKNGEVSAMIKQGFISSPPSSAASSFRISPPPFSTASSRNHPSPPPSTTTLFDMIAEEDHRHRHYQQQQLHQHTHHENPNKPIVSSNDQKRIRLQERVSTLLAGEYPNWGAGDVDLTVSSSDGFRVSMSVHRRVLAARSRFFTEKLVATAPPPHVVEICECDDAEVYVEVVALMYCEDIRRKLAPEGAGKVLGILKVSSAIMFDAGVASCLEHLEAIPWSEEEEEQIVSVLAQIQPCKPVSNVLQRISIEPPTSSAGATPDGIFSRLLAGVLGAKDDRARREMRNLISGLLGDDNSPDVSKETLYHLCRRCIDSLLISLSEAAEEATDRGALMGKLTRDAENVQWMVEILIGKEMAGDFVRLWAEQAELAGIHAKVPCVYRYEISKITAQLCVAIGRGQILVPTEARLALLQRWLEALYEDFGWMMRRGASSRAVDRRLVEEGLCQTILTLPMVQQQGILLDWFDRFLRKGDDCPNVQRAFEIWWRRAFVRQYVGGGGGDGDHSQLQIAVCDYSS